MHPLHYAQQLLKARNLKQNEGRELATLSKVLVYRGLPSPVHDPELYGRSQAQKVEWERDPRVTVTLRPLKYRYQRTVDGRKATNSNGVPIIKGKDEKGVDVLCALAVVRETQNLNIDLVILASQDTDLEPALDESVALGTAKIETASWYIPGTHSSREIRSTTRRIWNTRLNQQTFLNTLDTRTYL